MNGDERITAEFLGFSGEIILNPKEEEMLKKTVQAMMQEDIHGLASIKKLLKDENTFSNSLGNIYLYLKDRQVCSTSCHKHLYDCPKKKQGYCLIPTYDSSRNEIKISMRECEYSREVNIALKNVYPLDINGLRMYTEASKFLVALMEKENGKIMKDSLSLIVSVSKLLKDLSFKEKQTKGFAIHAINSEDLPSTLLKTICYMFAKVGVKCSYLNTNSLFYQLRSYNSNELAEKDYHRACNVDVLFLEDFNSYPKCGGDFEDKYLLPFLESRAKSGKLTFCSYHSLSPEKTIKYAFKDSDKLSKALSLVEKIFQEVTIKDFSLKY